MSSSQGALGNPSVLQLRRRLWRSTLLAALVDGLLIGVWICVLSRTFLVHLFAGGGPAPSGLIGLLTGVWVASGLGLPLLVFHHLLCSGTRSVWLGMGPILALLAGMLVLYLVGG